MIVGAEQATNLREMAHAIANQFAYGNQGTFQEYEQDILEALQIAQRKQFPTE